MIPQHAIENVMRAAGRVGAFIENYQASAIIEAALAYADETAQCRQMAYREQWEQPGWRDWMRQRMRHDLLDMITTQGLVPVSLPAEKIRYVAGGFLDPEGQP